MSVGRCRMRWQVRWFYRAYGRFGPHLMTTSADQRVRTQQCTKRRQNDGAHLIFPTLQTRLICSNFKIHFISCNFSNTKIPLIFLTKKFTRCFLKSNLSYFCGILPSQKSSFCNTIMQRRTASWICSESLFLWFGQLATWVRTVSHTFYPLSIGLVFPT